MRWILLIGAALILIYNYNRPGLEPRQRFYTSVRHILLLGAVAAVIEIVSTL